MSRFDRGGGPGGRRGHRGLQIASVLVAALAAVLAILAEQGGLDRAPWRDAPAPAEAPGSSPAGREPGRTSPASSGNAAAPRAGGTPALPGALPTVPDLAAGTGLAELFPAPGELREVRATLARIAAGGPFPYRQDGTVFRNRERRLPNRPSGYYREYTVETPSEDDRGARRIVQGRDGDTWYTRDHYGSFVRIDPEAVRRAP